MSTATNTPTSCPLLTLSAELRNEIYRYALVDEDEEQPVLITKENCTQPALLATNRQIRLEAAPIYYQENNFAIDIAEDYDCSPIIIFKQHSTPFSPNSITLCEEDDEGETWEQIWPNLFKWLRALHADPELLRYSKWPKDESGGHKWAAMALFGLVEKNRDLPWGEVRKKAVKLKNRWLGYVSHFNERHLFRFAREWGFEGGGEDWDSDEDSG